MWYSGNGKKLRKLLLKTVKALSAWPRLFVQKFWREQHALALKRNAVRFLPLPKLAKRAVKSH